MRAAHVLVALVTALVVASFASTSAASSTTFGPKQYTRTAGPTQTFTEVFPRCAGAPCQLVVTNGSADGSNRISSASIFLNGKQILGPGDFTFCDGIAEGTRIRAGQALLRKN